jgi:hypothetical protein
MKPSFLLLLCFAMAASLYLSSAQSEKTDLEREIWLLGNGLESTEADLARSQNPSDPEYAYYHQSEAIYQSNLKLTQNALQESRAQYQLASKRVPPALAVVSAAWALWLCGYVFLLRAERRFMGKFNRIALLSLCTLGGAAVGGWLSWLISKPFYYVAWLAFLVVSPVLMSIFACLGLRVGRVLGRWLALRTRSDSST